MKKKIRRCRKFGWMAVWLMQIGCMLAVSVLIALSYYLGDILHGILFWGGLSIAGCISAYLATVGGLLNYAAWIAPPVTGMLGHYIIWSYMPGMGPIFLCAFISLVGAAAGEVIKRDKRCK